MTTHSPLLIAITPNPAIDVTITVNDLIDEATHRIEQAQRRLGGKGVNVAAVAAAQGYSAAMLGPVSHASLSLLEDRGLGLPDKAQLRFTPTPVPLRETWAIHKTGPDATVIVNERGTEHPPAVWESLRDTLSSLLAEHPGSVVTISGSWPPGTSAHTLRELLDAARTGSAKAVLVDCAGENLIAACRAGAIVKPNAAEIEETTGLTDPLAGAQQLIDEGASCVVVSLGEKGLVATTGDRTFAAKLPHPIAGNPTGAGDSLVAALAAGILDGDDLPALLTRGVAWSAAAVLVPYAGAIDDSWPQLAADVQLTEM